MTTQHMVVAEHVCRSYRGPAGPVTALDDVSFTLAAGRVILLLGANGAGKSTLVHIACQVLKPDSGRISLGITRGSELGWCSQTQMIDWWATVYGNVYLGPRLGGSNRKEAAAAARAALELVGLAELGNRHCDSLSGGQLQRVQVARALAGRKKLIFLDEPTVGLDADTSLALLDELLERARAGATVVIATHELDLVERHCDEVLLLERGRLVDHTVPAEFIRGWSTEEVAELSHEGELTEEQLATLKRFAVSIEQVRPFRARVARGQSHRLLQALSAMTAVTGFRLESPGLREAFLKYRENGVGE